MICKIFVISEDWFEEEAADIEQPHIQKLTQSVEKFLQESPGKFEA